MAIVDAASVDSAPTNTRTSLGAPSWSRWFYVTISLVLVAVVIRGFSPSYFAPLLSGDGVTRPWIIHIHSAVFSGWMLLLLAQVSLVATGGTRLHRRLGSLGIGYGALVLVLGVIVTFVAPALHVRGGEWTLDEAASFIVLPLVDMVLFAGFFGAAIRYRRRPEVHKRLILAATVALAFAAVARMNFASAAVFYLVWLAPMLVAMAYDVRTRQTVHPVHFVSMAVMSVAFVRVFFMNSEPWRQIGRALLVPFV